MRKAQSKKLIEKVFESFCGRITGVQFEANLLATTFKRTHKTLTQGLRLERKRRRTRASGGADQHIIFQGITALAYDLTVSVSPPKLVPVGIKGAANGKYVEAIVDNLNSQFRWLLVTAFEAWEGYVKELYAVCGFLDKNTWTCADFGDVHLRELAQMPMAWFQRKSSYVGRQGVEGILRALRAALPDLSKCETQNGVMDSEFSLKTLSIMRHVTVHSGGSVANDRFHEVVLQRLGFSETTDSKNKTFHDVNRYFKTVGASRVLWLVKRGSTRSPYSFLTKELDLLVRVVSSHALLLKSCALKYFGSGSLPPPHYAGPAAGSSPTSA